MTGSDEYGNGIIASLVKRFLPGQKLDNFIETIKGDKTLSVLWSKQTRENFTNNFLDSITPTNTKSFIKKKKGYLEAEDKYYIPGVYEGVLAKGLELSGAPTNERYHDNTMGHYDTLSFLNDIARANGIKEISTSMARALTKEGLVGVANQVPGSMPNGFNAFDIDDATRIEGRKETYTTTVVQLRPTKHSVTPLK